MLMEEKDLFEEQNKEIEIAYTFSPVDKGKESKEREGKAKDKEDNRSPRISYSLSKGLSHPAHGEQLSLWPEFQLPAKKQKQKPEPFYFTPIQHQLIRAFSIYISQHGDNDKIAEFKKEIENGEGGFFSKPIPISNTEIGKIIYGSSYRAGVDGQRVFEETLSLANKWVAQLIETFPQDENGNRLKEPKLLRFSAPVIQIDARVDDPLQQFEEDIDISLIKFGRILLERLDSQWIPQPLTIFNIRNEKGRKITTELSYTLLGELETLWKSVMGAEATAPKEDNKRKSKPEKDEENEKKEKALWRELKFSTIKETCSTDYRSGKMRITFLKNLEEAFFGYQNSLGIITAYQIQKEEEKVKFRLNPYYGRKETTDKLIEANKQKEKDRKEKRKAEKEKAPEEKKDIPQT